MPPLRCRQAREHLGFSQRLGFGPGAEKLSAVKNAMPPFNAKAAIAPGPVVAKATPRPLPPRTVAATLVAG